MNHSVPVITIDGPSASGKGTIAALVAQNLGWHNLDSGALYRLTALACSQAGVDVQDARAVSDQAASLDVRFQSQRVYLQGQDVSDVLRAEHIGNMASQVAAIRGVRQALLAKQFEFRQAPGLVADGRDMGTVVFPDAPLKIFLVADVQERARRRHKQLKEKGISANIADLTRELGERDKRDCERKSSPLAPAGDAVIIDSTSLGIQEVVEMVLARWACIGKPL